MLKGELYFMETGSRRLKVLIIAHELSPQGGSECAVGWNIVTRLANYHDVTVIYASGSQFNDSSYVESINRYFKTSPPINGLTLINMDKPPITKFITSINYTFQRLSPIGLPMLYFIGYKYWQKALFHRAKQLHLKHNFNVVHQLTQITFREPGYLWKLGIPFFWGPTGGTSTFPKSFYKILSLKSRILDRIRTLSLYYQFYISSRISNAISRATIIYTFSKIDEVRFKKRAKGQVKLMLDVGTYSRIDEKLKVELNSDRLKGIWCGRLDEYKAPTILLNAIATSDLIQENVTFQIIGSGTLEKALLQMADELKLNNIEWIRNVSHDEVFNLMGKADFFVHTSIREATSSVIPEALSMGLPVICHNAYGMGIAVNDDCGIKFPLASPEKSIKDFRRAIEKFISDRIYLRNLKLGALKRSGEINWDNMARTIAVDYIEIVNLRENNKL